MMSDSTKPAMLALGLAVVLGIFATPRATMAQVQTRGELVGVDFAADGGGKVVHRYNGILHSLSPTEPAAEHFEAIKPFVIRCAIASGDFANYPRITKAGGTFQYLLSDAVYIRPEPIPWPGGANGRDFAAWEALVLEKINAAKAAGAVTGQWDIWNEPDFAMKPGGPFWPFQDQAGRDRFYETWRRAYVLIRRELPQVEIVGPSLAIINGVRGPKAASINMGSFVAFAKANDCLPDVYTIHVFGRSTAVEAVEMVYAILRAAGVREPRVAVNEFADDIESLRPGVLPRYWADFHRLRVEHAVRACWDEGPNKSVSTCWNNSLNGLLTHEKKEPRATWWVYRRYAELAGRFAVVRPSTSVDGLASIDADGRQATVLIGRDFGDAGKAAKPPPPKPIAPVRLDLRGLATILKPTAEERVMIEIERIVPSGLDPMAQPRKAGDRTYARGEANRVVLNFDDLGEQEAVFIRITVVAAKAPPAPPQ
jgi:hypothetical protein